MNHTNYKNILQPSIHLSAGGLVFALPFLIFGNDKDFDIWDKMLHLLSTSFLDTLFSI